MSTRRAGLVGLAGAVVLVFLVLTLGPGAVGFTVNWLWFREIGFEVVYRTELITRAALFLGVGAVSFAWLYLNLRMAQRGAVLNPTVLRLGMGTSHVNVAEVLRRFRVPLSLLLALLIAGGAAGGWLGVLRWMHRVPFGVSDPVFGRDVGFYVFTLPVISTVLGILFTLTVLALLLAGLLYWLRRDIIVAPGHVRVEASAGMHLGMLLALAFVLTALTLWLVRIPGLLYSTTGPMVGASYTDLHATLPALRIMAGVALVAAVLVVVGAVRRELFRFALMALGGYAVLSVLARGVYPAVIQNFVVDPTELSREAPQLRHHIAATRRAWGIENVEVRDLTGGAGLTLADIRANAPTIGNVRLWDRAPLLQTFGQLQEIRTYYDFVSVDDDRYWIDGEYRQVLLSPRELNPASLPTRTFINEHLTFTHGMGLALGPVNRRTAEGLPVLFIRDLPPESDVSLQVTRPQIYYGELTNQAVFVHTRQPEFDYPAGEQNIFTAYQGAGGVPIGSWLRRIVFASYFGSSKVLLSGDLTRESRVLYHRNVVERARRALPFLTFDGDPYMVIDEAGTLQWILDAYTKSERYPYAQRLADGTSYMRNSVKVVIDAYHGSVRAYVMDPAEPIVRTYARAFPGIFRPIGEMPADLRAHLRYPEDLYRVQTTLHTTYHMDEPDEFYHREDQWQIPTLGAEEQANPFAFMRRIIMRLPDEEGAEFIFMTPFTPRQKDNMAAWMVARSDGEHYGELRVYRFPKQSLVFGPRQIVNRINQDTEISRQISLWDQRGSEVLRGELLVLPVEESLLYVQPLYLRAQGGQIPELKRVIVAYQSRVVMEETLEDALAALFGGAGTIPPPAEEPAGGLV
ncbi:MAG TPA: UPF0182 family protein, partial [Longimicrobiaceae bacterium]|nr:UPF0182 family protein [Longimicrobiaceae bacterium]